MLDKHILSLSYGKDSLACFGACEELGWPIDGAIHAEIWATDTIQADLPPMVEFKARADEVIKKRWGIEVIHTCAMERSKQASKRSYENRFYTIRRLKSGGSSIYGFPCIRGSWCASDLKIAAIRNAKKHIREYFLSRAEQENINFRTGINKGISWNGRVKVVCESKNGTAGFLRSSIAQGAGINIVQYIGIAADEPVRIKRNEGRKNIKLPLVEAGWTESMCMEWCKKNDLLSPIYTTSMRGGCWFCHNQGVNQLRLLRRDYPDLWALLMKWDTDSPVNFHPDGHTVHDFDQRFELEDMGLVPSDRSFRWAMVEDMSFFL